MKPVEQHSDIEAFDARQAWWGKRRTWTREPGQGRASREFMVDWHMSLNGTDDSWSPDAPIESLRHDPDLLEMSYAPLHWWRLWRVPLEPDDPNAKGLAVTCVCQDCRCDWPPKSPLSMSMAYVLLRPQNPWLRTGRYDSPVRWPLIGRCSSCGLYLWAKVETPW